MNGKTLRHYRVGEQLGRGGMGEVYVADDLNLNRKVALKFLPDAFTGDPERMARFEREAKLLASLNHPNIAAIYGLEQAEGKRFIVMELVEGETLAQRLGKGALPVDEALVICRKIAEGLEAAHEKGVIHRDLKPANVMITEGDKVKILDFGLAKALSDETQSVDSSQSPTLTEAMTRPGVILGTAAYMSPEQAKGKSVDKRADIWAFGCILFETLTGSLAFSGNDVTDILAAVIRAEPDWSKIPTDLHWRLRELLVRCLEKDSRNRYHDISDVRLDIQKALAERGGLSAGPTPMSGNKAKLRTITPWIAATAVLCFIIAGIASFYLKPRSKSTIVSRLSIVLPPEQVLPSLNTPILALSPNGTKLAYVSGQGNYRKIYLRRIDSFETKPFPGTEGAENPFFSPDGQWLGFVSSGRLMKVQI